ncbi:PaaI family thioesterase [Pigmentiphaga sp. H8]|uniref:PaaI family thioesterase n=1 Tax=Pigmentiphaga sp. H8 TaxID=2488560 RepID=UPI000F59992B|nr:PaaI family thioesterase [Pigmentiphaga sp. H8]AZG10427.1 PaaI family thioesterase [Pigmentiphaga sp. H8]
MTLEELQALVSRGPYLQWLGLKVLALEEDSIEVSATWREEWVASTRLMQTHGGILASLIDFAADFALVRRIGHGVPTIDLRVDYHRLAKPGDLIARGRVIKHGRQFSVCEAQVLQDGKLIASGRGTYITAPPQP